MGGDAALCGSGNQAVRWTAATGWVALAILPGAIASQAFGVNADGSVLTGVNYFSDGTRQAFRWTAASGTVGLGFLPGGNMSGAGGVSANGKVVVGGSNGTSGNQAFRWTAETGMVGLGFLPGATDSGASRVNASGDVVVGNSGGKAFLWTAATGMQSIQDLLSAAGATVNGWQLTSATGVSASGHVISGQGIDPSGRNQKRLDRDTSVADAAMKAMTSRWTPIFNPVKLITRPVNVVNRSLFFFEYF